MDKIQTLFTELKHLLALDCIQSNRQLYFPLEESSLTNEESFVVSQCEEMYHQLMSHRSRHCITSEVFIQDVDLATLTKDINAFGRAVSAGTAILFARLQDFLNDQCGASLSMTSLVNCSLLIMLRHTASYYNVRLILKDLICESLAPLAEERPAMILNNDLLMFGLLSEEEGREYLKHAEFIQHLIEDNQTFVLFLLIVAIDNEPQHDSFRRYIGRLLLKKIYIKTKAELKLMMTDEDGYPKVVDNARDLIQEKEPPRSMDVFDDFFQSFTQVQKSMLPLLSGFMVEQFD